MTAAGLSALVAATAMVGVAEPASAEPPPGVRVLDGFDRADSTSLGVADTGQGWSVWSGAWGVSGGRAAPQAGGYSLSVLDSGGSAGVVSVVVAEPSPEFWLVVRASDGANYWRFGRWQSGTYQLQQIVNNSLGGPVVSVSATLSPAAGDVLECELRSPGVRCAVNGVTVVSTADGFNGSASRVGFATWDPSGSMASRFDSLSVRDPAVVADLSVGLSDLDPVVAGGGLRWTATVSSVGAAPAESTALAITLPSGLTGVSVTSSVGSCSVSPAGCALGSLAVGATATVVVEATAPSAPGPVTLTVAASSPGAANTGDDTRSETTTVQAELPPGVRVLDGFDRADSTSLGVADTGQGWSVWSGAWGVSGGRAAPQAGGYSLSVLDSGGSAGVVSVVVAEPSPEFWLVVRASDGANYWRFGRWQSGTYQLQQIVNNSLGGPVVSVSATLSPAAGDVLECELRSPGVRCAVNGVTVVSTADGFNGSASRVGFATWDPSGSMASRFDSLSVRDPAVVADLSVGLSDLDPVVAGGGLRWTATVSSVGAAPAESTALAITLPSGLTGVSVTSSVGSCSVSPAGCALGSLAVGATATVVVEATAPSAPGPVTLTVAASSPGAANTGDDTRSETTTVQAELPPGVRVLDGFDRADSTSLGVADTGQGWSVWSGAWGVSGGRAAPQAGGYSLSVLDSGGSAGVVSVVVAEPSPEFWLVVRASDGANYWRFGRWQSGTYQLQQIVNNSLGGPVVSVSATLSPAAGDVLECELRSPGVRCAVNGVTVVSTADGFNGSASRVGFATWDPSGSMASRFDSLSVRDPAVVADLSVGLSDLDPVVAGGGLRWTATVSSVGAAPAESTALAITLPSGLTGVSVTSSVGSCSVSPAGCALGSLAVGATATVVVEATAPSAPGPVTLTVAASSPGAANTGDDTRSETTTVQAELPPGVRVLDGFDRADSTSLGTTQTGQSWTLLHGTARITAGRVAPNAGYTLAVVDGGGSDGRVSVRVAAAAPEIWLALRVADGANYWRFGRSQSGAYQLQHIVNNNLGTPAIASTVAVSAADGDVLSCRYLAAAIQCSVNGTIVASVPTGADSAALRVGFASWDPAGSLVARFDDLVVEDVPMEPDLGVVLTDDDPVSVGGTMRATATVSNAGTSPTADAVLTMALPAGLTAATVNTSHGACTGSATVTCPLGTLTVGATATVVVTSQAPPTPAFHTTTASVSADGDTNPSNDTDSETTWVRTPPMPGAQLVDSFNRTGSSLGVADTGEPWVVHAGSFGTLGTAAVPTTGDGALSLAAADPGWDFGTYELTVDNIGDGRFWAAFRIVDALNYYRVGPDATGRYQLDRIVNGLAQPLAISIARQDVIAADGDRIRIVNRPDDGVFVSVNGVHIADAGDVESMTVGRFGFATRSTSPRIGHVTIGQVMTSGVVSADAFDRPDSLSMGNMPVGTHYAWFLPQDWGISNGQAYLISPGFRTTHVDTSSEFGDVRVTAYGTDHVFAVVFRYDHALDRYYRFGRLNPGGAYDVDLVEGYASSPPPVAVERLATVTPAAGDVVEVRQALDGGVDCLVNGTLVLRFTDTVTSPRSTIYGMAALDPATRFDNLTIVPE